MIWNVRYKFLLLKRWILTCHNLFFIIKIKCNWQIAGINKKICCMQNNLCPVDLTFSNYQNFFVFRFSFVLEIERSWHSSWWPRMSYENLFINNFWRHWSLHDLDFLRIIELIDLTCFYSIETWWHLSSFFLTIDLLRKAVKQPMCCSMRRFIINK